MASLDRPDAGLPAGFDAIDLSELLDVVQDLIGWLRDGTFDEAEGEAEAARRARSVLSRYRGIA